jgi:hypothetical protein
VSGALVFLVVQRTPDGEAQVGAHASLPGARRARRARLDAGEQAADVRILAVPVRPPRRAGFGERPAT